LTKSTDVAQKVRHERSVSQSRHRAIGLLLGYPDDGKSLAKDVSSELSSKNMKAYVAEITSRELARVEKRAGPFTSPAKKESVAIDAASPALSSMSVAGERAALGLAPPCGAFKDLVCLSQFAAMAELLLDVDKREELTDFTTNLVPHKKAINELLQLGASVAKELLSAATAARKRVQQEAAMAPLVSASAAGPSNRPRLRKDGSTNVIDFAAVVDKTTPITTFTSV
jgi:hypothetical protein